jgi:hypothetical protein
MKSNLQCDECCSAIPWYINGTLSVSTRKAVDDHLAFCGGCQREFLLWGTISHVVEEDAADVSSELAMQDVWYKISTRLSPQESQPWKLLHALRSTVCLWMKILLENLGAQVSLIKRDLWGIMLLGLPTIGLILLTPYSWETRAHFGALAASFITALGMTMLYGQEVDPAYEMVLATPTSTRFILLCRLCIVFLFTAVVNIIEILPFFLHHVPITMQWIVINWLAPLCCLTAISLLLSVIVKPIVALVTCTLLWLLRIVGDMFGMENLQKMYEAFWHQGALLFVLAVMAIVLLFFCLERKEKYVL